MVQCKIIAQHLQNSLYCDSILRTAENEIEQQCSLITVKDSAIAVLTVKICNADSIVNIQQSLILQCALEAKAASKKLKQEKLQKRMFVATTLICASLFVFKNLILKP